MKRASVSCRSEPGLVRSDTTTSGAVPFTELMAMTAPPRYW